MSTAKKLCQAFQIFSKYSDKKYILGATHEKIRVNINPDEITEKDLKKLKETGFHQKREGVKGFYYYT